MTDRTLAVTLLLAALGAAMGSSPLSAQVPGAAPALAEGVVTAMGTAEVRRQPDRMRMQVEVYAKDRTLDEALKGLSERIAAARARLDGFGADKDSVEVGDPKLDASPAQDESVREMLAAQGRLAGLRGEDGPAAAAPVTVKATLTAEWALDAKTTEEILRTTHPLQERIREADLSGYKDATKLSPEQQELVEEMEADLYGEYGGYGTAGEAQPGEPVFTFVGRISEEDEKQALAEAFEDAKADASRLAEATGAKLGPVSALSSSAAPAASEYDEYGYGYNPYIYAAMQQAGRPQAGKRPEAVGPEPGPVAYTVTVKAAFRLATGE